MTTTENFDGLRAKAEGGDADAQFALALLYDNADGVPRDPVAAANWYRFAAEQSHALAQLHLGLMLNAGDVGFERRPRRRRSQLSTGLISYVAIKNYWCQSLVY
jgi:TPR repeat protein